MSWKITILEAKEIEIAFVIIFCLVEGYGDDGAAQCRLPSKRLAKKRTKLKNVLFIKQTIPDDGQTAFVYIKRLKILQRINRHERSYPWLR